LSPIPGPEVRCTGSGAVTLAGIDSTEYHLSVINWQEYPEELFAPSPNLPPCGANDSASRTWVTIVDDQDQFLNRFCAFSSPGDLEDLWFKVFDGDPVPATVSVGLYDRLFEVTHTSDPVDLAPCSAPEPTHNRRIEEVEFLQGGESGSAAVRIRYGLEVFDSSSDTLNLNADIEVYVDGALVDVIAADATKRGAVTCAVTCAGSCPSIFGDGVCTGCSCQYGNWFSSAFGGGEGDEVRVRLVSARGGVNEFDDTDDVLTAVVPAPPPVPYDRAIEELEVVDNGDTKEIRFLYAIDLRDSTDRTLDLSADLEVYVNGELTDVIVTNVVKRGAVTCAVTCGGSCPSIFGDGVCTGCGCSYSNWFTSTFGGEDSQGSVEIRIAPPPTDLPELDDGNAMTVAFSSGPGSSDPFRRGDANGDGSTDLSDGVETLGFLFLGEGQLPCEDAADFNDDSSVDLADAVSLFDHLFLRGPGASLPGGAACGRDPSADGFSSCAYSAGCGS